MRDAEAIEALLQGYFDGLYRSDAAQLAEVLHPEALYATTSDGALLSMRMEQYLPIVAARPSPQSCGEARQDRILSVEVIGGDTALARVQCAIAARFFTDLLSLVKLDGRWWIMAKVFHYDLRP